VQVIFCGTGWLSIVDFIRDRLPSDISIRTRDLSKPLLEEIRDADVLLPSNARIDAAAVQAPPRLVLIQQPAVGTDGIDIEAARARGVPVCNTPGTNGQSVAEAALLLMLALARRLNEARRAFADEKIGMPIGVELAGKTLGIVGKGRAGTRLACAAEGLGMRVLTAGRSEGRARLLEIAEHADFLSIHCPLTPETAGLIDAAVIKRMKRGSFLINCARGPIVDRSALEAALAAGHLAGAGLDTLWEEPWNAADPLYSRDDVIALPHVAGSTAEAFGRIADIVAENILRVRKGAPLLHQIG